jgi:hypothetical protein
MNLQELIDKLNSVKEQYGNIKVGTFEYGSERVFVDYVVDITLVELVKPDKYTCRHLDLENIVSSYSPEDLMIVLE